MIDQKVAIELDNVGFSYNQRLFKRGIKKNVLNNITIKLYQGETLGVIGGNGAGKSTLLKLMAEIIKPDEGVIINKSNHVMLLSLQAGFLEHLNGRENAMLNGMLMGMSKKLLNNKMDLILNLSGLKDQFYDPISTYSTGMRARLGFSIAMQADPEILLIDETLGVGDKDFRETSSKLIKERIMSDMTIVLISHSTGTLRSLCNRVLWLSDGGIREIGPANTVIDNYLAND